MKYINCGGQHSFRSRNCPLYKQDVVIQGMKTLKEISYFIAKKLFVWRTRAKLAMHRAVKSTPAVTSTSSPVLKEIMRASSNDT